MALGIFILVLCSAGIGLSAWRIWRLKRLEPPPKDDGSIRAITDRMERDFEEIFRKWEK